MAIESKLGRGPLGRPMGVPQAEPKKNSTWGWVIGLCIIVVVVAIAWMKFKTPGATEDVIVTGEYQAVFIDNGQVYFGRLKRGSGDFDELTDVFYLKAGDSTPDKTGNLALTKLGSEAHGPDDHMQINKSHILFIEDMKSDSKVVQAIEAYKSKK